MKFTEQYKNLNNVPVNVQFTAQTENIYKASLSDEVKKILSLSEETMLYDDKPLLRKLSSAEIIEANEDLEVDFIGQSLLPVFDMGDNDFVVFDFAENRWCLFNIVDEIKFKEEEDLLLVMGI
jgi:hypothetical protein